MRRSGDVLQKDFGMYCVYVWKCIVRGLGDVLCAGLGMYCVRAKGCIYSVIVGTYFITFLDILNLYID